MYDVAGVEKKWLRRWEQDGLYEVDLGRPGSKFYNLMEFPYPSAEGLHVGQVFTYGGADTYGRFMRMRGHDVFEPMGFDAFGINTENYALKRGINPAVLTRQTVNHYRENQMKRLGAMFDWSRGVDTSSPDYYRWTQWLFLKLYRAGLAVRREAPVNWCPSCLTVLANEQVLDGQCERCESVVESRDMTQWFLRITAYADRLLDGLEELDWPETSKKMQGSWIGRRRGTEIDFALPGGGVLPVFTTRADTVFGATFLALAPEHPDALRLAAPGRRVAVEEYASRAARVRERDRAVAAREKTGIDTGARAVNPATGEEVPVWVADYVLPSYGSGAVMAVPGHDERDHEFALAHGLPVRRVVSSPEPLPHTGEGQLQESGDFSGLPSGEARDRITSWLEETGRGRRRVTYRLRDWCISRQRYWGAPIPIVYCDRCGEQPVPEDDLPVLLPEVEQFRPLGTGQSPLAAAEGFVDTACPSCGGPARRETDVSDTFLDSAWYFLRYPSADRGDVPFDPDLTAAWLPVDMYMGGIEHVCMHHLYARFVTMALHDLGHLPFSEPFRKLRLHGLIVKDGSKMSKSRGNVVNPDEYMDRYGADTLRAYLLFMGPYEGESDFSDRGIRGVWRFLGRVWSLVTGEQEGSGPGADLTPLHEAVARVTRDLEAIRFHTAIAALMELARWAGENMEAFAAGQREQVLRTLALLLAPFAPMLAEEMWEHLGHPYSVHDQPWPEADRDALSARMVTVAVAVNGKVRDRFEAVPGTGEDEAVARALSLPRIGKLLDGREPAVYYHPDRLLNLVVK